MLPLEILGHHLRRKVDLRRNEAPLRLGQRPGVAVPAHDGRLKRKSIGNHDFLTPKSRVSLDRKVMESWVSKLGQLWCKNGGNYSNS